MHAVRIYGNRDLVCIVCEFKMPSPEVTAALIDAMLDFQARHKCRLMVTVEGLPDDDVTQESLSDKSKLPPLQFISTNNDFSLKMDQLGVCGGC